MVFSGGVKGGAGDQRDQRAFIETRCAPAELFAGHFHHVCQCHTARKKVNLTNILTLKQPAATEKNKQTRQDRQVAGDVVMDVVNGWSQDVMRH